MDEFHESGVGGGGVVCATFLEDIESHSGMGRKGKGREGKGSVEDIVKYYQRL